MLEKMTFEQAMTELETIVATLEKGELTLEQSIKAYEKGVKLTAFCNNQIKAAKLKIEEIKA